MPATVKIEDQTCTIEMLPSGNIRVTAPSPQFNAMNGPGTVGEVSYEVHPCQRHQFDFLHAQLPINERTAQRKEGDPKPWWSLSAGERAGLKE